MAATDTQPGRLPERVLPERTVERELNVSTLAAQPEPFQPVDEPTAPVPVSPVSTSPIPLARAPESRPSAIKPVVDDARLSQAIIGGPPVAGRGQRDPVAQGLRSPIQPGWFDKLEAFISRLSVRDNFWHSICSLLWLPLAFFSGIRLKELKEGSFANQAILPFRRFNRNWYRAMAGGALLANSEIAGGAYVFGICGADYTVVCKNLNYTFLRPCFGPAVYRMTARENIHELSQSQAEFNTTIDMEISQQGFKGERDRRVGKCEAVFHVTPKVHHKAKAMRKSKS
jgi:acyl-coenzyme A thioesterase PaaI-like protein